MKMSICTYLFRLPLPLWIKNTVLTVIVILQAYFNAYLHHINHWAADTSFDATIGLLLICISAVVLLTVKELNNG